ncbi:aconitate hydratase AcnA [Geminisphaera colitermitum]|uniref:aconitate hydratase AcnA n=1 Tax=Geminisphaera colitermitum TaxID=1148786 RepID=UPI000158CE09|nr:aconitate hydratase AcnA [Geminisphaera colitermitum]
MSSQPLPNPFNTLSSFSVNGVSHPYYSLPALKKSGFDNINRLPVSIRLVLESLLRNCDGKRVSEQAIRDLATWAAKAPRTEEIPFVVARIVLQDFTGVPLLVDLAAMRSAVARLGKNPKIIEPLVPVDLVVDHSVQVDFAGSPAAFAQNLELEFTRNRERYQFLKWGMQAFDTFKVVPPGIGIVHQVNLEYLAQGVLKDANSICYPDTLVGTDSHTTMINGIGIVGWGVGGIEAEAGMLGQPVYFLTPDVVGVYLTGALREGVTATDLALTLTQLLRKAKVVGKFVEFYGPGAAALPVVDRATIANMAPEYGATMGFFPIDAECTNYLRATGRDEHHVELYEAYYRAQGLWGIPQQGDIDYTVELSLDLATVTPSVAGPKRPQDRIELPALKDEFHAAFSRPVTENGFGKPAADYAATSAQIRDTRLGHGSVLIAAITSCTNTSNPSVMLAAGLVAKKAVERGLTVNPLVKTSLAPGSRVVTDYLDKTGLQPYLDQLGFETVGYGCTTCIGNSGPLDPAIEDVVVKKDLVAASVLSGNRNFEARVHQNIKANFLMSPPLVVAFALAGRVDINMNTDPLGTDKNGQPVYLRDLWPTLQDVRDQLAAALKPDVFRRLYTDFAAQNPKWNEIPSSTGNVYEWDRNSTYIQEPPFFENFSLTPGIIKPITGARALGIFGDSVTTDHISPAGAIKKSSPAGRYLEEHGVAFADFNSYGSRRGNDRIMTRGTFANVRIKNLMLGGKEGGNTLGPDGKEAAIYDAAQAWKSGAGVPPAVGASLATPAPAGQIYRTPEKQSQTETQSRASQAKPLQRSGAGVPPASSLPKAGETPAPHSPPPLIVIAGQEYGTGSSRDWAAKGTNLLGVKVVVAQSFERIHRSNLVGMGVLPLQFKDGTTAQTLKLDGSETYDVVGLDATIRPQQDLTLRITRKDGTQQNVAVSCRIDTPIEVDYYQHGGILPYVLRQIIAQS